ncbi:helix-turn-helix domain-containing protein [Streptomyces agglomeratus]|uniref:helix-turn-helix domain-containing protein n=1 Tax=Streptomyces agglomeratus TaxID=285458 RepID=UPI001428ACF4|nr:AraC family transcriptional regulator [Streptomyces agglomeratus]
METIRERYSEPLTLDELAEAAMVSKFHFLRTFRRITGVTPGRFLSAIRLHEAKRLLVSTSLNVSDIGAQVGYSSTGSFTRRFSESVGCSPTQYRHTRHGTRRPADRAIGLVGHGTQPAGQGSISGVVRSPGGTDSGIYIGVFESPILERSPAARAITAHSGQFRMTGIPNGTWYVHAVAHTPLPGTTPASTPQPVLSGTTGPVTVGPGACPAVRITLRPLGWANPPILFALPVEWSAAAS